MIRNFLLFGLACAASCLFPFAMFSQLNQNTLLPGIMPSNPQAYQFMKYGEVPVNLYTGTPDISVPLFDIEAKGLTVPVNLTYHPNGIQVNEEASWVGLGWNLSTDMELVQVIMGMDDFGHYRHPTLPDFNCLIPLQASGLSGASVMSQCGAFFLGHDDEWNSSHPSCIIDPQYTAGLWDSEPDIFYFSAAGYSGKFAMNWQTGQFTCLTDKNIKIEAPNYNYLASSGIENLAPSFIITLTNGIKLYFNLKESTKITNCITRSDTGGTAFTNTDMREEKSSRVYKITSIVTDQSDIINFTYTNTAVSKNLPSVSQTQRNYAVMDNNTGSDFVPSGGLSTSFFTTEQTYSYLSAIQLNDMQLNFISSNRTDLKEGRKLDRIEITYKGVIKKKYLFSYDYFTANTLGNNWDSYLTYNNYISGKTNDELNQRLRLNAVQGWDAAQVLSEKPYSFVYNTQSLPRKTSYATDYWGFYNGQHANNSFFENIYRFNVERDNPLYQDYENNNKSPNVTFSKAAVLERVNYPTGGYTLYNYELNSFDNYVAPPSSQGETTSQVHLVATNGSNAQDAVITEGGNTFFRGNILLSTRGCPTNINAYLNCKVRVQQFKKELVAVVKANSNYNQYGLMYVLTTMGLLNGSNTALYNQYIETDQSFLKFYNDPEEKFIDLNLGLKEGIALFTATGGCGINNGTTNSSQASISVNFRNYKNLTGPYYGAGLRIDSVKTYSANNVLALKKIYTYQTGKLMSPLLYYNRSVSREEYQQVYTFTPNQGCDSYNATLASLNADLQINLRRFLTNPTTANLALINNVYIGMENIPCSASIVSAIKHFNGYRNELSSSSFVQPSIGASGRYVGYDKVVEQVTSNNPQTPYVSLARTESYFINNPDVGAPPTVGAGNYTAINIPLAKKFPENGLLTKQVIYGDTGKSKETTFTYNFAEEPCLWGMKNMSIESYATIMPASPFVEVHNKYMDAVYPIRSGTTMVLKNETNFYEDGLAHTLYTNFEYDTKNQVSKVKTENSNGDLVETVNKYIYDFPSNAYYMGLMDRNIINRVMRRLTNVNGTAVSMENTFYRWVNTSNSVGSYYTDRVQSCKSGIEADLQDQVIYHYYDSYGNPTEVSRPDGVRISYIWGYKGRYPVARIENASHATGANMMNGSLVTAVETASDTGTEAQLITALDNLRASLPQSLLTGYTYLPLVGVSTVTSPNGYRIKYNYDGLGRLIKVKDNEDKMLSSTQYNFRP